MNVLSLRASVISVITGVLPWVIYASIIFAAYCVYEQIYFYLYSYSWKGMSWNSIIGRYMIFATDVDITRRALNQDDGVTFSMAVHPSGKNILGSHNVAFMHGPAHKAIRKSFLCLFTRKALSTYVELQDNIVRRTLSKWLENPNEREISYEIRRMNLLISQEVFVGPYMVDPEEREKFCTAFMAMTDGFLAIPILFPGTAVWKGRKGRFYIVKLLEKAAARSRAAMKLTLQVRQPAWMRQDEVEGKEPRCLMDYWAQRCLEEIEEGVREGIEPYPHTTESGMATTLMTFLFASQDGPTASLVWLVALMSDHPDVLAKVREEQERVRPDNREPVTGEILYQMTYARQVVKEILRYRAPAPMVPLLAHKAFALTEDFTVPKGTLVMPSLHTACLQGFSDPLKFDPDRFSPERQEDVKHAKNFLPFGCGPHYCVGKEYAINNLMVFLAVFSTSCDWIRRLTEKSKDDFLNWQYLPAIYPADTLITLSKRQDF